MAQSDELSDRNLSFEIEEVSAPALERYGTVSIAFAVNSKMILRPRGGDDGGWDMTEVPVDPPWIKDYDEGAPPTRWLRWDTSDWRIISAFLKDELIGGVVVAYDTPGADFLEGRTDIAALWDIRVAPDWRGKGVGSTLFQQAVDYARELNVNELKIETQDINATACKFYAKQGCCLTDVNPNAYPGWPDEIELIWRFRM